MESTVGARHWQEVLTGLSIILDASGQKHSAHLSNEYLIFLFIIFVKVHFFDALRALSVWPAHRFLSKRLSCFLCDFEGSTVSASCLLLSFDWQLHFSFNVSEFSQCSIFSRSRSWLVILSTLFTDLLCRL